MVSVKLEEMMYKSYRDAYHMREEMAEEFGYVLPPEKVHEAAMSLYHFRANRRLQLISMAEQGRGPPDDGRGTM